MGKPKKKVVVVEESPASGKKPVAEPEDFNKRTPVWRFSIMDFDGPFGCHTLNADKVRTVHKRLSSFESMTWNEIGRSNDSHFISVKSIGKDAQNRLAEIEQDDAEQLYSLRITGKERVWGIRDRHIFKLLWWDPEHEVYPVEKKNT